MDNTKFLQIYGERRNGVNDFIRHPLVRSFAVSDGIHDLAETGIWWLIDIAATELPAVLRKSGQYMGVLTATVADSKAKLQMTGSADVVLWSRKIGYTDMPNGEWTFFVTVEEDDRSSRMILSTEY